eukprot:7684356-Pyramimonas_sp.AAC.1
MHSVVCNLQACQTELFVASERYMLNMNFHPSADSPCNPCNPRANEADLNHNFAAKFNDSRIRISHLVTVE